MTHDDLRHKTVQQLLDMGLTVQVTFEHPDGECGTFGFDQPLGRPVLHDPTAEVPIPTPKYGNPLIC